MTGPGSSPELARDTPSHAAPEGHRTVIADDGVTITLSLYSSAQPQPLAAQLSPLVEIRLAAELAAAARHLARGTERHVG